MTLGGSRSLAPGCASPRATSGPTVKHDSRLDLGQVVIDTVGFFFFLLFFSLKLPAAELVSSHNVQQKQQQTAQQPAAVAEPDQAGPAGLRGGGGSAPRTSGAGEACGAVGVPGWPRVLLNGACF